MIDPLKKNTAIGGLESRVVTQGQIKGAMYQETPPKIKLGEIIGIDIMTMTCNVRVRSSGTTVSNVVIALAANSSEQSMLSTPAVGQTCLLITTSDLYNMALPVGMMSGENSLPIFLGESIVKGSKGQLLAQDAAGNHVLSNRSSVIEVQGKHGVKTESSFGRHERTTHSETISGMARSETDAYADIPSGEGVRGTSVEKYFSTIETVEVNPSERYILRENGNPRINQEEKAQCLSRAAHAMININYIRTSLNEFRLQMYNKSITEGGYIAAVNDLKSRIKTEFQIKKNMSLIVEKGLALNYEPENVKDITNISKDSVAKSKYDKNIVYRVKVVSPKTGLKLGAMYFDEDGNFIVDCNNFVVRSKYDYDVVTDTEQTGEMEQ